ncbi:hypothetical protein M7I_7739 [Glarea lozoyensis 74030]|uniref:Uncharacterized protein n=1 Tax=Glarea lozoyensis (strain ATCC 74030 / MF5533) TaxID=1104152 RepID=H0EY42_GLAL7|nr:hypothetical protein M7I_7739 [Glarea lozoyensis 74030]
MPYHWQETLPPELTSIEEEIFNLEDLKEEILALSAGVQESRNAV